MGKKGTSINITTIEGDILECELNIFKIKGCANLCFSILRYRSSKTEWPLICAENKQATYLCSLFQELSGGEEEDIFAKSTELQITRQYSDTQNTSSAMQNQKTTEVNTDETTKEKWETFDEDSEGETVTCK